MAFGEKPGALEGLRQRLYGDGPGSLSIEELRGVYDEQESLGLRDSGIFEFEKGLVDEVGEDPLANDLPEDEWEEPGPEGSDPVGSQADEAADAYAEKAMRRAQLSAQYQKMNREQGK